MCLVSWPGLQNQLTVAIHRGLGKTLQTISLLAYLRESRGTPGPHLVIAPKSVVSNWIREIKTWCPSIKAIKMGGTKDERLKFMTEDAARDPITGRHKWDVLVTSYEGILKCKGTLSKIHWKYLIIDEVWHQLELWSKLLSSSLRIGVGKACKVLK